MKNDKGLFPYKIGIAVAICTCFFADKVVPESIELFNVAWKIFLAILMMILVTSSISFYRKIRKKANKIEKIIATVQSAGIVMYLVILCIISIFWWVASRY